MLTLPAFQELSFIRHGFFTRKKGVSTGIYSSRNCGLGSQDQPDAVAKNRQFCAQEFGLPARSLVTLRQYHSDQVMYITDLVEDNLAGDALVTDRSEIMIGVLTADCAPVLFADHQARIIGAAHAGWRGALAGILEKTIAAMEARGADRQNIVAGIGPCLGAKSYEVGEEFYQNFLEKNVDFQEFFVQKTKSDVDKMQGIAQPSENEENTGKYYFDLPGFIQHLLSAASVGRIAKVDIDTYQDEENFYSYRRSCHRQENDYGRFLSAIALGSGG